MTPIPQTFPQVGRFFITSADRVGRVGRKLVVLRLGTGPVTPVWHLAVPQRTHHESARRPARSPLHKAGQKDGLGDRGDAGDWLTHRCSTAPRRAVAVAVHWAVWLDMIGFPGEVHHG